ncbi:MAG: NAD(P)H-dependent oxidoreductase, partial [Fretibacterium sp.]|nr:NAD(P)H-dependent oxidoreductase [Fretibacterium sp.]
MKVLVINASANREKSVTLRLTKAFLEGLGENGEFINTMDLKVNPCRACYACWFGTNGQCVQKDDATEVMEKIRGADLVIWSIPLYAYGVPSHGKALMDRTLCFNSPKMYLDDKGIAHHYGYEDGSKKTVLISTAGLPNVKGNFDGLIFQMKRMYGENTAAVCCAEGSLFMNPEAETLVAPYLENVRKAGQAYREESRIPSDLQGYLDSLLIPADEYVR